jgi:hypothetical protein
LVETIEQGTAGLFYLTDSEERAIFIAATTDTDARDLGAQARLALRRGLDVRGHTLHDYQRGGQIFIPDPKDMTRDQRQETIDRMKNHLIARFNN